MRGTMSTAVVDFSKAYQVLKSLEGICTGPNDGMLTLLAAIHILDKMHRDGTSFEAFLAQTTSILRQLEHGSLQ